MKISSPTPCLNFAPQKEYSAAVVPHPSKNAYADYVLETGKRIPFSAADLSNLYQSVIYAVHSSRSRLIDRYDR